MSRKSQIWKKKRALARRTLIAVSERGCAALPPLGIVHPEAVCPHCGRLQKDCRCVDGLVDYILGEGNGKKIL